MGLIFLLAGIFFVVVLGDIAWLELTELAWQIRGRLQPKLSIMKRKRPERIRWKFR